MFGIESMCVMGFLPVLSASPSGRHLHTSREAEPKSRNWPARRRASITPQHVEQRRQPLNLIYHDEPASLRIDVAPRIRRRAAA
jgi:hypothetical protein